MSDSVIVWMICRLLMHVNFPHTSSPFHLLKLNIERKSFFLFFFLSETGPEDKGMDNLWKENK